MRTRRNARAHASTPGGSYVDQIVATFAALAVIGLAAVVAALPATAQSSGEPSGSSAVTATATATTTATATATATPAPPPTSFAITPHVGTLNPRALTRLGNQWFVAGWGSHGGHGRINVFSNDGTFENRLGLDIAFQGLTNDGTNLIAVSGGAPRVYTWNPSTDSSAGTKTTSLGNNYRAKGIAHDGINTWIAVDQPQSGTADLLKLHGKESTLYRVSTKVNSLTHQGGFLYGSQNGNLVRIKISDLSPHTPAAILNLADPPMNTWEVVKRNAGIRLGLVFHNGIAYGFNADQDEVRAERGAPTIAPAPASPTATPAPTASPPSGAANPSN